MNKRQSHVDKRRTNVEIAFEFLGHVMLGFFMMTMLMLVSAGFILLMRWVEEYIHDPLFHLLTGWTADGIQILDSVLLLYWLIYTGYKAIKEINNG